MGKVKIALLLAIVCTSVSVFADELTPTSGWYVRFDAGFSNARDPRLKIPSGPLPADLGSSSILGGGLGYSLIPGFRTDLTFTYRSGFDQSSGFSDQPKAIADFKSLAMLLSLYFDVLPNERISPFFGFGIGAAKNELQTVTITNLDGSLLGRIEGDKKTNFAWQFAAGGVLRITDKLLLDAGYHYLSAGDYISDPILVFNDGSSTNAKNEGSFHANEFILSLQYVF